MCIPYCVFSIEIVHLSLLPFMTDSFYMPLCSYMYTNLALVIESCTISVSFPLFPFVKFLSFFLYIYIIFLILELIILHYRISLI